MKRWIMVFPKIAVRKFVRVLRDSNSSEIKSKILSNKYLLTPRQIDFVLSFSPESLTSELNYGFSPYYHFLNVLKILDNPNPTSRCAVYVNKMYGRLVVYDKAVQESKPGDSYFMYIESITLQDCLRLVFTNSGKDRFYLDVYSPDCISENQSELRILKAEKIIWNSMLFGRPAIEPYHITFELKDFVVTETIQFRKETTVHRF